MHFPVPQHGMWAALLRAGKKKKTGKKHRKHKKRLKKKVLKMLVCRKKEITKAH